MLRRHGRSAGLVERSGLTARRAVKKLCRCLDAVGAIGHAVSVRFRHLAQVGGLEAAQDLEDGLSPVEIVVHYRLVSNSNPEG